MSGFTEKEVGLGKIVSSIEGVRGLETGDLRWGGKEGAGAKDLDPGVMPSLATMRREL